MKMKKKTPTKVVHKRDDQCPKCFSKEIEWVYSEGCIKWIYNCLICKHKWEGDTKEANLQGDALRRKGSDGMLRTVERNEDMSPSGKLQIHIQDDGDILVSIIPDKDEMNLYDFYTKTVEFCAIGSGGGRSPRTLDALRKLMNAMEEDNNDRPINT